MAVSGNRFHAHALAVLHDQGDGGGLVADVNALGLDGVGHGNHEAGAAGAGGLHTRNGGGAGGGGAGHLNAALDQPLDGLVGLLGNQLQHRLVGVAFGAGVPVIDQRFDGVFHAGFLLELGAGGIDHAAGDQGIAAVGGHLLQKENRRAGVLGVGGSSQASRAAADDDHVIGQHFVFRHDSRSFAGGHLEGFRIAAGSHNGLLNGFEDRIGGEGRAGHHVDRQGLAGDDGLGDLREGGVGQTGGLGVRAELDVDDLLAVEGHDDFNGAVHAFAGGGVLAGGVRHGGHDRAQHAQAEHQGEELLHNQSSPFFIKLLTQP